MKDYVSRYEARFYDHQLPEVIKQLTRIANALEQANKLKDIELRGGI